jgi:2,4-dienoyl-CoA reductase-like NADH-dependent reductase (Old Yellow Enzyme family)
VNDPLLSPFQLKHLTLRNRVVSTSHEPAYGEDGMPKDRYRRYHVEKARGGVALTMIGGSAVVSPDSPPAFGNLLLYSDDIVPWLARLADEVHEAGAAVMCQVTHLGRRTSNYAGDWLPVVAASPLREAAHRAFPKQAEEWDLDRIAADYASAALRCQAGGLDGIEIESYGHLLDGFVSPATNHRADGYGGSLENRLAFPRRVIRAVRAAVGPEFIVGIRMAVDEDEPGWLGFDEGLAVLRAYIDDGIDFVSAVKGHIDADAPLARVIPSMGTPSAPFLGFSAAVKRAVDIPVMHAARIADVATARYAVREGLLDLVGMTRAQIADPHLVRKVAAGQEDRIRPCVGASYCLDAIYDSGDAKCVHNPATGREQALPHEIGRAARRRKAVVIGGGPAGLEAARVLAARGHDVVLLEADSAPGGQVRLAALAGQRRRDLIGIVDWRVSEAKREGADLRFGAFAEVPDVLAEQPDVVIVATGGLPDRSFLETGQELVADSWDILSRAVAPGARILLYDDNGGYPGMDAAEFLARAGAAVEYVTPERRLAPDVGSMNSPAYLEVFARHAVATTLAYRLRRVERAPGGGLLATLYSEYARHEVGRTVDQVVVEHGTLPNDDLYTALLPGSANRGAIDYPALLAGRPQPPAGRQPSTGQTDGSGYQLYRVGDAVASRNIHAAILDSLRLCAAI